MGGPRRERMVMLVVRVEPGVALRFALGFAVLGRVYWDGLAGRIGDGIEEGEGGYRRTGGELAGVFAKVWGDAEVKRD